MTIELIDIPAAVASYLDTNVTTTISTVTPSNPHQDVLTPGQDGTFKITIKNATSPDGIRLINVMYHVKISDDQVAKLIVPQSAIVACFDSLAGTNQLPVGTKKSEMFVRNLADTTLDVDDSDSLSLELHCVDQGDAKLTCHVHADIDESDLFPTSQSPNGEQPVSVV